LFKKNKKQKTGETESPQWPKEWLFFKKKKKKEKEEKRKGWPNHPMGGGWPPLRQWGWLGHP
jgi:hypothetical protein